MKVAELKDLSIYSTILRLFSYTPPSFVPPFEPFEAGSMPVMRAGDARTAKAKCALQSPSAKQRLSTQREYATREMFSTKSG